MSQPPYGTPGPADRGEPRYNLNTGLPESSYDSGTQQYGSASDPYGSGPDPYSSSNPQPQYGAPDYGSGQPEQGSGQYGAPGQYGGQQDQYGSQPTVAYGTDQYGSGQYGDHGQYAAQPAAAYGSGQYGSQPGQYGGDPAAFPAIGGYGAQGESDKSFLTTWLLGWLLGSFGADRFYLGKFGTAIAKLVTAGGLGIWTLIDLIMHLVGATRDREGRTLAGYDQHKKKAWIITIAGWLLGVIVSIIVTVVMVFAGGVAINSTTPSTTPTTAQADDPSPAPGTDDQGSNGTDTPATTDPQAGDDIVEWADSRYGTFDPITVSGSGDDIVPVPDGVSSAIVTVTTDSDFLLVSSVDSSGEMAGFYGSAFDSDTIVGTVGVDDYREATDIEIDSADSWEIVFAPISSAPELPTSGEGSGLFLYDGVGGPVRAEHEGESNFIVLQYGEASRDLVLNEIGEYSGTVRFSEGPTVVSIDADGSWTFELA